MELKSEALKERHWKQLTRSLGVSWVLSELTLGHVWDVDLMKNEAIVRDIISVAQGEMALEEFLKQVSIIFLDLERQKLLLKQLNICLINIFFLWKGWQCCVSLAIFFLVRSYPERSCYCVMTVTERAITSMLLYTSKSYYLNCIWLIFVCSLTPFGRFFYIHFSS